jgi:sortilin-related receptor
VDCRTAKFEYLPAISTNNIWKNNTKCTESNEFRLTNLKPFTLYNLTIFVRAKGSDKVFLPYLFYEVVTNEGCEYANWSRESAVFTVLFLFYFSQIQPNPPNVSAGQINKSRVQVSWESPKENGFLDSYTDYYK